MKKSVKKQIISDVSFQSVADILTTFFFRMRPCLQWNGKSVQENFVKHISHFALSSHISVLDKR
jgi:hypothetical protein